jgi:hypothetical protein
MVALHTEYTATAMTTTMRQSIGLFPLDRFDFACHIGANFGEGGVHVLLARQKSVLLLDPFVAAAAAETVFTSDLVTLSRWTFGTRNQESSGGQDPGQWKRNYAL